MKSFLVSLLAVAVAASPLAPRDAQGSCDQPDGAPAQVNNSTVCPCWSWYKIQNGDDCGPVAEKHGITKQQLESWNPWLNIDGYECVGMWPRSNVCVGITPPDNLPPPPCNKNAPYPQGKGTVCNCKQWYKIQNGDDCAPVAAKFNISKDQLLKWNPWLTVDGYECAGMWPQSNVCVAI